MQKITVITVCYNSAETILQTIQSVLVQTYPNLEYIIVDGQSTDNTLRIIHQHKERITKIISEKDSGLYEALNRGLSIATGDVIGILHSDDFYTDSSVLEDYMKIFNSNSCDAVYADLYYVAKDQPEKIVRRWKSGAYSAGSFLFGWMPPHPTFFVRRSVYEKYGLFNLQFKTAADYELMLRFIHKHRVPVCYLPRFTVKMRAGGQSNASWKNRFKANQEDRKAWEVNDLKPYFFTLYLKPLRKIFQFLLK